jgi:hypothetical protein
MCYVLQMSAHKYLRAGVISVYAPQLKDFPFAAMTNYAAVLFLTFNILRAVSATPLMARDDVPEVIPGPGLPSLESLGVTSAELHAMGLPDSMSPITMTLTSHSQLTLLQPWTWRVSSSTVSVAVHPHLTARTHLSATSSCVTTTSTVSVRTTASSHLE